MTAISQCPDRPVPGLSRSAPAGVSQRALLAGLLAIGLGVARTAAATPAEDVDYLFRLGMLEGHLMIGHELVKAGQGALALPHFGHPVRELYDDIEPYIAARKVGAFDTQLIGLEAAVAGAPTSPATEAMYQATIATVRRARLAAPEALRASVPEMIRICSDTIEAAAGEYGEALNRGRIDALVEYHDSRGYLAFVGQEVDGLAPKAAGPADQGLVARFRAVLAKAQWIVEPLLPSPTPRASVSQYRAIAGEAAALTKAVAVAPSR